MLQGCFPEPHHVPIMADSSSLHGFSLAPRSPKPLTVLLLRFAVDHTTSVENIAAASGIPHVGQLGQDVMSSDDLPAQVCSSRDTKIRLRRSDDAHSAFSLHALDCPPEGDGDEPRNGPTRKPPTADGRLARSPSLKRRPFPFPLPV